MLQRSSGVWRTLPMMRLMSSRIPNQSALEQEEEMQSVFLRKVKHEIETDKKKLAWRTPVGDRPQDWNTKLKAFDNEEQTSDFIIMMQQPIDLTPTGLRNFWNKRKDRMERALQQYVPERHRILGADLAAAHFILYRGGAVRFVGAKNWMRANDDNEFKLPSVFHADYKVEALRCDEMNLYYEGLENIRCLQHLKFLSFHKVKHFDDWCLDRVSGSEYPRLEVLDISTTKCTNRGLSCLYRLPSLKLLIVNNPKESLEYELTCAMLEEMMPKLKVAAVDEIHDKKDT